MFLLIQSLNVLLKHQNEMMIQLHLVHCLVTHPLILLYLPSGFPWVFYLDKCFCQETFLLNHLIAINFNEISSFSLVQKNFCRQIHIRFMIILKQISTKPSKHLKLKFRFYLVTCHLIKTRLKLIRKIHSLTLYTSLIITTLQVQEIFKFQYLKLQSWKWKFGSYNLFIISLRQFNPSRPVI